ncbi:unnamed protein product, partial [Staurois parvus]
LTTSHPIHVHKRPDTGAEQERVAVYKQPPHSLTMLTPWERAAPRSGARCARRTLIAVRPISDHIIAYY